MLEEITYRLAVHNDNGAVVRSTCLLESDVKIVWSLVERLRVRSVYKATAPDSTSGQVLRNARMRQRLSQAELAELVKCTQGNISDMENNRRTIGKELAKRFASIFGADYRRFL